MSWIRPEYKDMLPMPSSKDLAGIAFLSQLLADALAGRVAIRDVQLEDAPGTHEGDPPPTTRRGKYRAWWLCRIHSDTLGTLDGLADARVVAHQDLARLRDDLRAVSTSTLQTQALVGTLASDVKAWRHAEEVKEARMVGMPHYIYVGSDGREIREDDAHEALRDLDNAYRYDGTQWTEGECDDETGAITWASYSAAPPPDLHPTDRAYHERRWRRLYG